MKSNQIKLRGARLASVICLLAALAPTSRLIAQSEAPSVPVPAPTKDTYTEDDVVELSPWEVNASADTYYRDKMAVTAAGVVASVRETPLSIDIITSEQLRDNGVNEFNDAFRGTAGISTQPDDVMNPSNGLKIRGFPAGRFLRNGFVKYYFQNLDGVDRIEVVRGPVAAFYGQAEPGGVVNYITKKPLMKWQHSIRATYGSNEFYKVMIDSTGPIIKDMLAYRVVTAYQNSGSWKQYVTNERPYLLAALRFKPFEKLQLDFDYEYNLNRQRGAVRTGLVENSAYLADYTRWQGIAKNLGFTKFMNSTNALDSVTKLPKTGSNYNNYNLEFFTRYPYNYSVADMTKGQLATLVSKYPWMGGGTALNQKDPRTGDYQQPFISRDSAWGTVGDGGIRIPTTKNDYGKDQGPVLTKDTTQLYRHGWRTITMFEKMGAFDPATGKFKKVDMKNIDSTKVMSEPVLTQLAFPTGVEFNPNGPGAWYFDESHVATGEIKLEATDWLNFKYGSNYYENWSKQVQQYNSDTDMDGYTLDAGQGFPTNSTSPTSGATGFSFYNVRWVHQLSADIKFDIGETKHNLLFTTEYRDDRFVQFNPEGSLTWFTANKTFKEGTFIPRYSPGFALWDIYNDKAPDTAGWTGTNYVTGKSRRFANGNKTQQQGYGASYRVKFLNDKAQIWTGIRHERQDQQQIGKEDFTENGVTSVTTGTTPMYGISYEVVKKLNIYASYSESFINRGTGDVNYKSWNPNIVINNPALAAWIADKNNPKPDPSTVSLANFEYTPPAPLSNPKGIGYEAGVKYDVEGDYGFLSGTFAVFHLERQGLINTISGDLEQVNRDVDDLNAAFPNLGLPTVNAIKGNSGKEQSEGVELNLTYVPVENLQITASASYLFKKEVSQFSDLMLYGNKLVAPDTENSLGKGPIGNPSLFYYDDKLQAYLPKWPTNFNGTQEFGEQTDPKVASEAERLAQAKAAGFDYYPEVYLPKYSSELNNVPDLQFSLSARYDVRDGFLKGARAILSYTYEGSSPVSVGGEGLGTYLLTPFRNPEVHMFDGTIGYKLPVGKTELDFSFTVRNIFDGRYTKGSFGILDPRTYQFSVEYKF